MNKHERRVRIKAYQKLVSCWKNKKHRIYSMINLFLHIIPFMATKLQGSFIDRFYEKMEKKIDE